MPALTLGNFIDQIYNNEEVIFMRVTIFLIAIFLSTGAIAEKTVETWECWDRYDSKLNILITAEVLDTPLLDTFDADTKKYLDADAKERFAAVRMGKIIGAGKEQSAYYYVEGLNRRWSFDSDNFSLTINPNGNAQYYDFTHVEKGKSIDPAQLYKCREKIQTSAKKS